MPKGPKGEKRPIDVIGAAVKVLKIATGEIEEDVDDDGKNKVAVALLEHGVRPHGGLDRRVLAVALHEDVGGAVDVEVGDHVDSQSIMVRYTVRPPNFSS